MEFIRIIYTEDDVLSMAEEFGISEDEALRRAESWGKHIESTASELCAEQLSSAVQYGTV